MLLLLAASGNVSMDSCLHLVRDDCHHPDLPGYQRFTGLLVDDRPWGAVCPRENTTSPYMSQALLEEYRLVSLLMALMASWGSVEYGGCK